MQETLAAAVVLATGWHGEAPFVNPMCGSGTIAIEAALVGIGRAPGLLRQNFGFMHVKGFDAALWERLKREAGARERKRPGFVVVATDLDPKAVAAARKNASAAKVDRLIRFQPCDFAETEVPPGGGVVLLNPEYGERMGEVRRLREVYGRIGDFFKKRCLGYTGYIFTGNLGLAKQVGLRTARRIPFYNSNIECRLLEYPLYPGSRKTKERAPG
jgi:putative N6-adenine-specific DNA methylase